MLYYHLVENAHGQFVVEVKVEATRNGEMNFTDRVKAFVLNT